MQCAAGAGRRHFPVRRHHAVLAEERRPTAACAFPMRCRRATRPISTSPTFSTFWSTIRTPNKSCCSSKASGGRSLHARRRRGRSQAGKPVLAIKTGATAKSRTAARSHTGAIGGDYAAYLAMCERYGIVNCRSLDDLLEMHAGVPVRPAAKGPTHRFRHHFGRHGRSALRLCRDRRRGGARIQRRHQRRADAAHAGRHRAEKPARHRHSDDAQGRPPTSVRSWRAIPASTSSPGLRRCRARAAVWDDVANFAGC